MILSNLNNFTHFWSCESRQRDTTSSEWKCQINNLAVKGLEVKWSVQIWSEQSNCIFSILNEILIAILLHGLAYTGVTAQKNPPPPDWTIPGYSLNYALGIVWELPDYTPGYTLGAPRVYPTSPDYAPPDSGWGIVWAIVSHIWYLPEYSGRYHIWLTINYRYNIWS